PHIGTTYTTILADTLARYHRLMGHHTFFLTGTDEHGDKIARSAAANGESAQSFVNRISEAFRGLWPQLYVHPDRFIRTTDPDHVRTVQHILQKVYDSGDIYFGEYGGLYCLGCERFYTEKELVDGVCPDHKVAPEFIQEKNYFFRMSKYQEWLGNHIADHPDFIRPERYRNEVLGFLREPLEDLCISRPTSRLTWGIPIPFDDKYVTYVWFDALINYLTGIGYPDSATCHEYWEQAEHLIGKDILKPHAVYWPTMLRAAGIPPYAHLTVHGYWNFEDTKISKSLGTPLTPLPLVRVFGVDALRYFLMRDMVVGLDARFSVALVVSRLNSDLANDFGNLLSRVARLTAAHFEGRAPHGPETPGSLASQAAALLEMIPEELKEIRLHNIIEEILQFVRATNRFLEANAPWKLAKENPKRAGEVIYEALEALRIAAICLSPVMPERTAELLTRLGQPLEEFRLEPHAKWGRLQPGTRIMEGPALFPRIPEEELPALLPEILGKVTKGKEVKPTPVEEEQIEEISLEEFLRIQLKVARVLSAERLPKSDKLLRLIIDLGNEKRQIIAGIAEYYAPESLIGKSIAVVTNLKPVRLRGEESRGMLLAALSGNELGLLTVDKDIPSGASIH
ncbi:MAG: methionine--tRNA ligase, partial [bacterium]